MSTSIAVRLTIGAALLAVAAFAGAQPSMHRIGWLSHGSRPAHEPEAKDDFSQVMRDAKYFEGRNLAIEYRHANGDVAKLPRLAAELVELKVNVIVTSGEPAALAAQRATKAIPIVFTDFALDPVEAKLVTSLGRPEGNVTGFYNDELWGKRLQYLSDAVPKLKRVAVLSNPDNPGNVHCVNELRAAAKAIGAQVDPVAVGSVSALDSAFADITRMRPDAIGVCGDMVTLENAARIGSFALSLRLPVMAPSREYVVAGSLVSYGANLAEQRRRAAQHVLKILKGTNASTLPVERFPTNSELVWNAKTRATLRIATPQNWALSGQPPVE